MNIRKKPPTVMIDPETLSEIEAEYGSEEAQKIVDQINKMASDGTLFEKCVPVDLDVLAIEEPEVYQKLVDSLQRKTTIH